MSVPNEYQLVVDVVGPRLKIVGDEEETRANSFWAVNDGCHEARKKDSHWGLLVKTGGAQVEQRAADIWLYNLGNGTAQVVDVVSNAEGAPPPEGGARTAPAPAWGEADIRPIDQWVEPYPRSDGGEDSGEGGGGEGTEELQAQVDALEGKVAEQQATLDAQADQLAALESTVANLQWQLQQPLHCHGPVDLPIVVENWNRMRAKGDIDVVVTPGTAVPPPESDYTFDAIDIAILKKLLGLIGGERPEPPPA